MLTAAHQKLKTGEDFPICVKNTNLKVFLEANLVNFRH